MLNFLIEYFNYISNGLELFAALIGVLYLRKYKNTTTKYFIYFLIYIVFVEAVGIGFFYFHSFPLIHFLRSLGLRSVSWYNIFWMFGSVLFGMYYFHALFKLKAFKTLIKIIALVYSIAMLSHFYLFPELFLKKHAPFYQLLGAFATLICVVLYFIELLKSDNTTNLFNTFGFYASIGLFLWWLIITPVIFYNIYNTTSDWDYVNLKRLIFLFGNMFMYLTFAFALIWCVPQQKALE